MKRSIAIGFMVLLVAGAAFAQNMMNSGNQGLGMMGSGGNGYDMMGGSASGSGMMNGGMMGGFDFIPPDAGKPLTLDQAVGQAQKYLASWGDDNLVVSEVTEFSNHFYVEVGEKASDQKAFELLMNKYTGSVSLEPGPNMMWNQKYGPMASGMMGGFSPVQQSAGPMSITEAKARELAQKTLDSQGAGLKIENGADRFYGYYTLHVLKDGKTYGMLGVNGYSGQVWYHNWHGKFIDNKEVVETK